MTLLAHELRRPLVAGGLARLRPAREYIACPSRIGPSCSGASSARKGSSSAARSSAGSRHSRSTWKRSRASSIDIALAQIAALGATAAFLAGIDFGSPASYGAGLGATLRGALVLAFSRPRERRLSQEAVIGVVYAVSAAGTVLLASRAPHGAEHLRAMLVGSLLAVRGEDVAVVALLYSAIGALHWACRRPFFLITADAARAWREGWRVRAWDLLFYATFGVVVTSSVRVAGVLLVFAYLIAPAMAAMALARTTPGRLAVGWLFGTGVSVAGIAVSATLDLPPGATVVCASLAWRCWPGGR